MAPNPRPPGRPRPHPSRGPAAPVAVRLKAPDRARLVAVAAGRGLVVSDFLRGLILDALDGADGTLCDSVSPPAALAV